MRIVGQACRRASEVDRGRIERKFSRLCGTRGAVVPSAARVIRDPSVSPMPSTLTLSLCTLLASLTLSAGVRAGAPALVDTPYPGTLTLQVDATDLDRRILRVKETVPVTPGPLTLYFPRWLPGNHGPTGRIGELAGLKISAAGKAVAWKRDPIDVHAFALEVPAGVDQLEIEFQSLTPISSDRLPQSCSGFHLAQSSSVRTIRRLGRSSESVTAPASGRNATTFRPYVVRSSDLFRAT